ncbi:CCA tRNA nucleotidyltransferase [Nakamurella flavida]|uniref:CCA tRNA nucleotidyltransferase n=1 Tax=Nakamurella flavida TaxID=363630 RepID=A0A938YFM7_9ACTN|nr:CCA tRNA nucleotidyltransferase [Nakamurella flavida]MBM9476796.1 CCA tRNA nucleotidyltransferase [Nakamurella flavida]MDP9778766.1 poly(A) polymerase [Nakamurella flavida]
MSVSDGSGTPGRLTALQQTALVELFAGFPAAVQELGERFAAGGHELHLVGGTVRDFLLGRAQDDLDFTTDARPERVLELVAGWAEATWDTGIDFGTVGVLKQGHRLEITTFRADLYDGQSRNPAVTYGDTLLGDLQRRDFAVNAMAVSVVDRHFTDPFGGLAQLAARVLDTPGTPEDSFRDDPLRMLRAARFAAQLGFTPAPRVVAAMAAMSAQITRITVERVTAELVKLIEGRYPRAGLTLLVDTGLAGHVLPELPRLRLQIDEHHQHKDVYDHSLMVLDQAIAQETDGPDRTLRLAALLHDIGKPDTRRLEEGGGVSFHHHEVVGRKLVRKRMRELKFPKAITEDVAELTFLHLRFHGYGSGAWTDSAVRRYVADAGELLPRLHKLVRADCTTRNPRRKAALQRSYDQLEERIAELSVAEDLARVRPDLDGNAIMELLGVGPGPVVGRAWKFLKELKLDRGPLDRDEAEALLLVWAREQGLLPPG